MRKLLSIALGVSFMLITPVAEAQLGGMLNKAIKKGVQKGIEKTVEKKAEEVAAQEIEKALDNAIPTQEQTNTNANTNASTTNSGGMTPLEAKLMNKMGMSTNVPCERNYFFNAEMTMDIEVYQKGMDVQKTSYKSYFDLKSNSYAMDFNDQQKGGRGLIVFDSKNGYMLILNEENGKKSGIAMPVGINDSSLNEINNTTIQEYSDEDIALMTMYRPTGRTKKINGYSCKEYFNENENGRMEIWATRDIIFDYSRACNYMGGMQVLASGGSTLILGTTLEMHFTDKLTSDRTTLYVRDINMSKGNSLNISDYEIIGMGMPPAAKTVE